MTHVVLPEELVAEVDKVAGKRGRSRFIAEAVREHLRRLELRSALKAALGVIEPSAYPEFSTPEKRSAWVRSQRTSGDSGRRIAGWSGSCWIRMP